MTKAYLKFPQKPLKFSSRRLRLIDHCSVAYKTDAPAGAGGGDDDEDEEPAEGAPEAEKKEYFLKQVEKRVKATIQERGYKNGEEIKKLIDETLKDVPLEGLRKFNPEKISKSVKNIAGQLEKVEQRSQAGAGPQADKDYLREMLHKPETMQLIERAFKSRRGGIVELSTRAIQNPMTTDNVIDDTIMEDNPTLIESFSIDRFVKKRRPGDYIWDIVARKTLPSITEFKTWMEEGSEDGSFAIVAEGEVKPLLSKKLVRNVSTYKKVAGKRVYTEEFAKFRAEAYGILEDLFNDKMLRDYSALVMVAVLAQAASYTGGALDGLYDNPTDYHAIGAVAAQEEALDFNPDILVINPQDKWRIALEQDKNGQFFMNIPMYTPTGEVTMLGFRLKTSNKVPVGNFVLGEARLFKIEDEPVKVRMGYGINVEKDGENVTDVSSDFDNNRFRIISETFFHAYIPTNFIGSFVYGNFADIKAALLKPAI